MRTFMDAKTIAKTLRSELAVKKLDLTHSESLELVSRLFGFKDWNRLAARIGEAEALPTGALKVPDGWVVDGPRPDHYELGIDPRATGVAVIRSRQTSPRTGSQGDFATLMQTFLADTYLGQRLRLVAELKADTVAEAMTLWMRIDGSGQRTLQFENMEQRQSNGPLSGTTDWTRREIVLNVPEDAQSISFGFYLRGAGTARARSFELSVVGDDIPTTARTELYLSGPANLSLS